MKSLAAIVITLLLLSPTLNNAMGQGVTPPPTEKLTYMGYYNWGFIWIKAGKVTITQSESDKYPNSQYVEAVGYSLPSWDDFFQLRDTLYSHFDNETFLPYEFSRKAHEGKYNKTFDYYVNYPDSLVYLDINKIGVWERRDTLSLVPDMYDILSLAYYLRGIDVTPYEVGDKIPIKLLVDNEVTDLYIRYLGTNTIKIAGEKRKCYIFAPLLVAGDVFKGGENMKIWLSADEARIPLLVESKVLIGSVKGVFVPSESKY